MDNDNLNAVRIITVDGLQHGRLTVRGTDTTASGHKPLCFYSVTSETLIDQFKVMVKSVRAY